MKRREICKYFPRNKTVSDLRVKVTEKKKNGTTWWEGLVNLTGVSQTKLTKADGDTKWGTRSSVQQAARRLATKLGLNVDFDAAPVAVAKRKVKTSTTKSST